MNEDWVTGIVLRLRIVVPRSFPGLLVKFAGSLLTDMPRGGRFQNFGTPKTVSFRATFLFLHSIKNVYV